jgi:hypothetical protein
MGACTKTALPLSAALVLVVGSVWMGCSDDEFTFTAPPGTGGSTTTSVGGAGGSGGSGGGVMNCVDADSDGTTDCEGDCDDNDPNTYPGAPEICGDGVDNTCGNDPDPASTCMGIGTYVSATEGLDTNPGTQVSPVQTITEGMNKAVLLSGAQPVFVGEGTYPEDVTLVEGIDLLGGHQCNATTCDWARDSALYVSTIENQDDDGIYAGHGITRETLVEGFTVLGLAGNPGSGNAYAGFFVQGAPELRGNHIISGNISGCSQCQTNAITMSGAPSGSVAALIEGNVIDGGSSDSGTIGIRIENAALAEIKSNEITGGTGQWTRCISISGNAGAISITDNDMHAGSCNGNNTTFAMFVGQGVAPVIDSNRINADPNKLGTCPSFSGTWWTGGIESEGSQSIITNNVIYGVPSPRSTAVMLADCEGTCQIGQAVVNSNTLHGGGMSANNSISVALVFKTWKQGQNVVVGRVRNNILIGGDGQQSFGGYEDISGTGSTAKPQQFENNDLFDATELYFDWTSGSGTNLGTITLVNSTVNGASNNISQDPLLDATDHLQGGSPCIDAGTTSGGETPTVDIDGETRPKGNEVDIGADEAG